MLCDTSLAMPRFSKTLEHHVCTRRPNDWDLLWGRLSELIVSHDDLYTRASLALTNGPLLDDEGDSRLLALI